MEAYIYACAWKHMKAYKSIERSHLKRHTFWCDKAIHIKQPKVLVHLSSLNKISILRHISVHESAAKCEQHTSVVCTKNVPLLVWAMNVNSI